MDDNYLITNFITGWTIQADRTSAKLQTILPSISLLPPEITRHWNFPLLDSRRSHAIYFALALLLKCACLAGSNTAPIGLHVWTYSTFTDPISYLTTSLLVVLMPWRSICVCGRRAVIEGNLWKYFEVMSITMIELGYQKINSFLIPSYLRCSGIPQIITFIRTAVKTALFVLLHNLICARPSSTVEGLVPVRIWIVDVKRRRTEQWY